MDMLKEGDLIFGTDGVRDKAGQGFLRSESVARIARAAAWTLLDLEAFPRDFPERKTGRRAVYVGRDTRESGPSISSTLLEAFRRAGLPAVDLGVLPTPGVAR